MLCLCLLSLGALRLHAQQPPAPPRQDGDSAFSLELFVWPARARPVLRQGEASESANPSELTFPGRSKPAPGGVLSIPAGPDHHLRISYFQTRGSGATVASRALTFYATGYSADDVLSTRYKIQNAKISLDYLSYPAPPEGARLRLKTLWEVQLTSVNTTLDAPFKPVSAEGGSDFFGQGTHWFVYPTFGLGLEHLASPRFRWELKGSGFGVPGYAMIWDAELKAAYRFGRVEAVFGAKAFHFRTSPKQEEFVRATLPGAFVGLRWRSR
jgi:hypothetical protein